MCALITANPLPLPIGGAATVNYDGTIFLIGGYNDDTYNTIADIYQYNVEDDSWEKLQSELKTPREMHVSLLVPRSLFPECT